MKTNLYRPFFFLAIAASLSLLSSCEKEPRPSSVTFRVTSSPVDTRTAYGDAAGPGSQYLKWEDGDLFRILMFPGSGASASEDYSVSSHTESGGTSSAKLSPVREKGLQWGEGTHLFYCLYPSPATAGMSSSASLGAGSGTQVNASCTIPRVQSPASWSSLTGAPDMRYAYMYASASSDAEAESVTLDFYPRFTAFQFEVSPGYYAGTGGGVRLTSFRLSSAEGYSPLTGTFGIGGPQGSEVLSLGASVYNEVTVDLSSLPAFSGAEDKLVFTVFALPRELSGLTLSFTGYFGGSSEEQTRSLTLKDASGTLLTFGPCKKYRLYGLAFSDPREATVIGIGQEGITWDASDMAVTGIGKNFLTWDATTLSGLVGAGREGVSWDAAEGTMITGESLGIIWADDPSISAGSTGTNITWDAD